MTTRPVAVVTGASSGIGAATARHLAAAGFEVVCAARRLDRIEELAKEIDGRAILVRFVISDFSRESARFEQSFSGDGGKTWETNWIAVDTRLK